MKILYNNPRGDQDMQIKVDDTTEENVEEYVGRS